MPIFRKKDDKFFAKWSPEMAYVLGFFAADGNMTKNKRGGHFISFEITDKELLEKIRESLKSNHKITLLRKNKSWKPSYRLQIGSKEMFLNLVALGMTPKKSKTLKFPIIPPRYLPDFVRGYFDGDGNVTIGKYIRANRKNKKSTTLLSGFISGSKNFLEGLRDSLKASNVIKGGTLYYGSAAYRLYFSVNDSFALYRFMYKDIRSNLFLPRKKKIFEKYFNLV